MKVAHILVVIAAIASVRCASSPSGKPAPPAASRTSGVITIRGTSHPYLIEGTGVTCIIVGPAPQYARAFSDRLKQHLRLVYVDFKQSWNAESDAGADANMDTLVDEVDQVRRALGLDRICVLGHSAAGIIALEYAARHAALTTHVIVIGTPPFLGAALGKARTEFWDSDASPERKAAYERNKQRLPDDVLKTLSPRDAFAMRYVRTGPKYFYDASYDYAGAWLGQRLATELVLRFVGLEFDPRPRLASNTAPVLVLLGRYDYAVPYPLWDGIEDRIPHVTRRRLERSGHFPMLEEPAAFDDAIIRWLEAAR